MKSVTEKNGRRNRGLWEFAVALYGRPGVAPACLTLQNRHGVDVPLLLAAIWHGASGRGALSGRRLARWRAIARRWRTRVIERLRGARNALKTAARTDPATARLRKSILAAELEAERMCLAELAAHAAKMRRGGIHSCGIRQQENARLFVRGRTARTRLIKIISRVEGLSGNQGSGRRAID
ncbi:MAG: TIGR02444 family protein [Alphaproteobacteria bacterium]|nr:TIGR02444 family protein [Alphaproteobacteria bacterium]